ncbi:MAG: hypothetical protein AM1032_000337 [Mycoplasmataceae bacterium]|nr:MAG: hypothetical protein AM1032_000337 [Mycoplasmataceae bacterium]
MDKLKHYRNMILADLSLEEWYLRRCDYLVNYCDFFKKNCLTDFIKLRNELLIFETLKDEDKDRVRNLANKEIDIFIKDIIFKDEKEKDKKIVSYCYNGAITIQVNRDHALSEFFNLRNYIFKFITTNHIDLFEFIKNELKFPVYFDKYTNKELYYDVFSNEENYRRISIYPEFLEDYKERYVNL